MGFLSRLSLQYRVAAAVALGMLVLFSFFGYLAVQTIHESTNVALSERQSLAQTFAASVDNQVQLALSQLKNVAELGILDATDGVNEEEKITLNEAQRLLQNLEAIYLLDPQGTILWVEPPSPALLGTDYSSQPHVEKLRGNSLSEVAHLARSPTQGNPPIAYVAVPVLKDGSLKGILSAGLRFAYLGPPMVPLPPEVGRSVYAELVDPDGYVLTGSEGVSLLRPDRHADILTPLTKSGEPGVTIHKVPGFDHVVAYAPLQTLEGGITVEQGIDLALAVPRRLTTMMLFFSSLALLISSVAAWFYVRRVVRPIRMLSGSAARIAAGDLDMPTPSIKRQDEIGELAQSFEEMRVKVKSSREEIQKWSAVLEDRVRERTDELEKRTQELAVLHKVADTLNRSLDLDEVLKTSLDMVLEVTGADAGSIQLLDHQSGTLPMKAHRGLPNQVMDQHEGLKVGECLCGRVALSGESIVFDETLSQKINDRPLCYIVGFQSLVALPLKYKESVVGILHVAAHREHHFQPRDVRLLSAISSEIAVAVENARLYREIQLREELRGELLSKVISAQEEERKRIARELHDEAAQILTAILVSLQAAEDALPPAQAREKANLAKARNEAAKTLREMREMILELRPTVLDDFGLIPAIEWYAENRLKASGIKTSIEVTGHARRLDTQTETALFRIVQEAINNITRHAKAREVQISLDFQDVKVVGIIKDDGTGFDVSRTERGIGLIGMQERASLLRGNCTIQSSPGSGTRIRVEIPIETKGKQ